MSAGGGGFVLSFIDAATGQAVAVTIAAPLPVDATVSAQSSAVATAANPAYAEGTDQPLSQTLFGGLRVTLLQPDGTPYTAGGGTPAVATAAAPTYVEGAAVALSVDLAGGLRLSGPISAAQSGAWSVDAVQSGAWSVDAVQAGAWSVSVSGTASVEGTGTEGAAAGGVLSVQAPGPGAIPIPISESGEFEAVAASQTGQVLGGAGAAGDELFFLLVMPATTSPGNVIILNNGSPVATFPGGASSVSNLVPFIMAVYARSTGGPWSVTTGANVSVLAVGRFT